MVYTALHIYMYMTSSALSLGATNVFSRAYYSTSVKNLNKLKAVQVTKYVEWALETWILYVWNKIIGSFNSRYTFNHSKGEKC